AVHVAGPDIGMFGYGGDNRQFDYDAGTARVELWVEGVFSAATPNPVSVKRLIFGQSEKYRPEDLVEVWDKPSWWKAVKKDPFLNLEAQPIAIATQQVNHDTLRASGSIRSDPFSQMPVLEINFHVAG